MLKQYGEGDKCPCCGGKGSYLMERDLHRAAGWVPCTFSTGRPHMKWGTVVDLRCVNGTLKSHKRDRRAS